MTPKPVLGKLAEDPIVFVRIRVAQNSNTPLLVRLNDDADVVVRVLTSRKRRAPTALFSK